MSSKETQEEHCADYGTDDAATIREMFQRAYEEQQRRESTFGGYLRALRRKRQLTEAEIATKAGISRSDWLSWEGHSKLPSPEALEAALARLKLSPIKVSRLHELLHEAPRHALRNLSVFREESLAARGLSVIDIDLEWEAVGAIGQEKLLVWAGKKGLEFPRDLLCCLRELRTDDSREAWISEVMGDDTI